MRTAPRISGSPACFPISIGTILPRGSKLPSAAHMHLLRHGPRNDGSVHLQPFKLPLKIRTGDDRLRQIIEKGAHVVGATTGAVLSAVTGNPAFGVGGAALGASGAYQRVGSEIADRVLGPREQARVGILAQSAQILKSEDPGALAGGGFPTRPSRTVGDRSGIRDATPEPHIRSHQPCTTAWPLGARPWSDNARRARQSGGRRGIGAAPHSGARHPSGTDC